MLSSAKIKQGVLLATIMVACILVFLMKPISQDPNYHLFADKRNILSIPNFWNVISNVPFLIIGALGMLFLFHKKFIESKKDLFFNKLFFFFGIFLTGIGSSYYHIYPTNETLLWDRLPMTISFMSFFTIIIGEYICGKTGKSLLLPLLIIGFLSLLYWQMTEKRGLGDLRFYALVQFLPLILIPLILILFKTEEKSNRLFWLILLSYLIAKLFELSDFLIFNSAHIISGHSIKHIAAAIGPLLFLRYQYRKLKIDLLKE